MELAVIVMGCLCGVTVGLMMYALDKAHKAMDTADKMKKMVVTRSREADVWERRYKGLKQQTASRTEQDADLP